MGGAHQPLKKAWAECPDIPLLIELWRSVRVPGVGGKAGNDCELSGGLEPLRGGGCLRPQEPPIRPGKAKMVGGVQEEEGG